MKKERIHYDCKFKENAVKLSYQRDNINNLARELGILSQETDSTHRDRERDIKKKL